MDINLEIVLYIAEAVCATASLVSGILFIICKDIGYLIISVIFLAGAVLSFVLSSLWPLAIGAVIAVMLLLLGSGIFLKNREW